MPDVEQHTPVARLALAVLLIGTCAALFVIFVLIPLSLFSGDRSKRENSEKVAVPPGPSAQLPPPDDKPGIIKWTLDKLGPGKGSDFARLVKGLSQEDTKIRVAVENALGAYADLSRSGTVASIDHSDLDSLTSLLNYRKRPQLQAFAVETIIGLRPPEAKKILWLDDPGTRLIVIKAVASREADRELSVILVTAVKERDPEIRKWAVKGLAHTSPDAKETVFADLMKSLPDQRIQGDVLAALKALGIPPPSQTASLSEYLKQNWPTQIRLYAVDSLGKMAANSLSIPPQLQEVALNDPDNEVQRHAVVALGKMGRAQGSVKILISLLEDHEELRSSALESLKNIGLKKADLPHLLPLRKSKHRDVRLFSVWALGEVEPTKDSLDTLINVLGEDGLARTALQSLRKMEPLKLDKSYLTSLASLVKSKDREVRSFAVSQLSRLGRQLGKEAIKPLHDAMVIERDQEIRLKVCTALGEIRQKASVPVLIETLAREEESTVRRKIAEVLATFGPDAEEAAPQLSKCLVDKDKEVRKQAAVSLGAIGPAAKPAVPLLISAFHELPPPPQLPQEAPNDLRGTSWVGRRQTIVVRNLEFQFMGGGRALMIETDLVPARNAKRNVIEGTYSQISAKTFSGYVNQVLITFPGIIYQGTFDGQVMSGKTRNLVGFGIDVSWTVTKAHKSPEETKDEYEKALRAREAFFKDLDVYIVALSKIGSAAVPALTAQLRGKYEYARFGGAKALGLIGPHAASAIPALTRLSADSSTTVREEAVRAINLIRLKK